MVQDSASPGSTSSVPSLSRTRPSYRFIRMRKSFTAVTVDGSSDLGSAIWPTTSTLGGVWAWASGELKAVKAARPNAARQLRVHFTAPKSLGIVIVSRLYCSLREQNYHNKIVSDKILS